MDKLRAALYRKLVKQSDKKIYLIPESILDTKSLNFGNKNEIILSKIRAALYKILVRKSN